MDYIQTIRTILRLPIHSLNHRWFNRLKRKAMQSSPNPNQQLFLCSGQSRVSNEAIGSSLKTQKKIDGVNSEANAKLEPEQLQELELELEPVEESSETKLEPLDDESSRNASDCDEAKVGSSEASVVMQSTDLSSWKVSELRALAKTRGIRRYSKLKKNELLELLIIDKA
ncbi:hypothetical protein HPP92_012470 [Vanilla planifolia]|uniref:Rho termination factor-like N-terminal domain-containing protein n=1 Tax=Vanilla planifolia TaxID=51239 RepID=A0A835QV84_VANPL|nr:hypothetical protein HPP92_012470 [Vanilla planifolia]